MTDLGKILKELDVILQQRKHADPSESYVARLYEKGVEKIAQKLGEEATETIIEAMKSQGPYFDKNLLAQESADLLFHLLILWAHLGLSQKDVAQILQDRLGVSGLAREKMNQDQ
jgi:phosphoribosyl-ATP pyrophosphohydrolase